MRRSHGVLHPAPRGTADHHHVVAREQLRDVADAADVGVAVLAREAEALGEVLAHLVAVERLDRDAVARELAAQGRGKRGLARPRQTREPEGEASCEGDAPVRYQLALSHLFFATFPFG